MEIKLGDFVRVIVRDDKYPVASEVTGTVVRVGYSFSSADHLRFEVAGISHFFDTSDANVEVTVNGEL